MKTEVTRFTNPAQDRFVAILRDHHGHYFWAEECFVTLDETASGGGIYEYWRPGRGSGIHETEQGALKEAAAELEWFRAMRSD